MTELFENIQKPETAVLVGVDLGEYDCEASLDELEELAKTAGAEVEARVTQRRETPDSATFIGSGRLREIKNFCADNDVDLLIFDSELTPSQHTLSFVVLCPFLSTTSASADAFCLIPSKK